MGNLDPEKIPRHVAVIPDGNGRWAEARGLTRSEGHQKGVEAVREVVRASSELGIRMLTFFAFSQENWDRPKGEISALMTLLEQYLRSQADELAENGIRFRAIGRLEELDSRVRADLDALVRRTERNDQMRVTFALSYSGRAEIVDAFRSLLRSVEDGCLDPAAIDEKSIRQHLYAPDLPDPDLLIRTGNESRISNFLLWQLAYTEIHVSPTLWPDFGPGEVAKALEDYSGRQRRFGNILTGA